MIKINIVILTLILLVGVVFAGDYWVDDNLNMLGNDVHNATNINATYIYMNGTLVSTSAASYTNGTGISLTGTTFSIVLSYFQGLFIELTDTFGGDVSGTYDNLIVTDNSHLHDAANITNDNWIEDSQEGDLNVNHSDTSEYITNMTERGLFTTTYNGSYLTSEIDPYWTANQSSYSTTVDIIAFGYYNSSDFVITDYFTKTDILNFNYYNSSDFSIADYFTSSEILAFDYYNASNFDINDYFTSAEILGFDYYNLTDFDINDYFTESEIIGFGYYNSTVFSISDYFTKSQILGFGYYNSSDFSITDYYLNSNPYSYYNSTTILDYRLNSWDNFTGIPTASPSDGDTTHLSTADQIRDYVISFGYSTTTGTVTSIATSSPITGGTITTTGTISLTACGDEEIYKYNITSGNWECEIDASGGGGGAGMWADGGTYIYPNSTYADNIIVNGYIKSEDWTNVSITESQISDFGTYRLDSWNNLTGIPHATPSNGDVTHFSYADEIYDWIIDFGYTSNTGTITAVTGTSPIVSSGGTSPAISATILKDLVTTAPLTGAVDNVFLGTDSDLTIAIQMEGDLVTTAPLTGTVANIFPGTGTKATIAMPVATTSASGYLSTTDWNTFNNKGSGTVTSIATTAPISGGTITSTGTLSITNDGIGDTQLAYNTGQHLTATSTPTFATISTGQGQYELFAMNQDVESTDAVTFATINTGQGANELYDMNQNVQIADDVQFQNITSSGNITISQDNKFCYNAACTVYSYFNGTCLWHVGLTSVDIIC